MRFKLLLNTSIVLFFSLSLFAQTNPFSESTPLSKDGYRLCYTSELAHEKYNSDPAYRNKVDLENSGLLLNRNASSVPFSDSVIRIPVNFIVVHNGGAENISQAQIESQIRILNESYRKIPGTPGFGNGVDTKIEFFLAQKDPNGNCIDGIERHQSSLTIHNVGPQLSNTFPPMDYTKYLNVYVVTSIGTGGTIGYTYLANNNGGDQFNSIYIAHHAIGDIGTAGTVFPAISSGTVLAHEAGHWLNLLHVFEPQGSCPSGNCATSGDFICDTPPQQSASPNGCNPANSCGTPNNINNYMDYGSDNCFNMFTDDQKSRMQAAITQHRPNLMDSTNAVDAGYYGCLGITYCQSQASNTSGTEIQNMTLTNVTKNTVNECTGYSSFNTTFANVTQDSSYVLSVTTGHCSGGTAPNHEVKAFIDWNRDGDFVDPGEEYLVKALGPAGTGTVSITVPGNAPLDRTGLRIIATDGGVIGPCATYAFGETEDYGIQVLAPPPTITSFAPSSGPIGQLVYVTGDNFSGVSSVTFNNTTTAAVTVISDDSLRVNVPANATSGPITVTTPIGSDVSAGSFNVTTQLPTVNTFSPDSGFVGDPVVIFGSNLGTVQQVFFNSTPVTSFTQPQGIEINTTVPPGATTGKIQVQNAVGIATSANDFIVRVPPTTASISGTSQVCDGTSANLTFNLTGTPPFDVVYTDGTNNFTLNNVNSPHVETVNPGIGATTYTIISVSDTNKVVTAPNPAITGNATITVNANPSSASLSGTATICEGDTTSITFNASGGSGPYDISIDNGLGTFNNLQDGAIIVVSPTTSSTYSILSLNDNNGCSTNNFTGSANVNVNAGPDANFNSAINKSIVTFTDLSVGAVSWLWEFGDSTSSIQQNPVHTYLHIGIKNVRLTSTNSNGCIDQITKNLLITEVSGFEGLGEGENINIYPNPADNEVKVDIRLNRAEKVSIDIVSIDGKKMMKIGDSKDLDKHIINLNVDDFPSGIYILKIELSNGRIFNTKFYKN